MKIAASPRNSAQLDSVGAGRNGRYEKDRVFPHVHRAVYFKTPAEHNRALLEGAIRCLSQFLERNAATETTEEADVLYYTSIALQKTGIAFDKHTGVNKQ